MIQNRNDSRLARLSTATLSRAKSSLLIALLLSLLAITTRAYFLQWKHWASVSLSYTVEYYSCKNDDHLPYFLPTATIRDETNKIWSLDFGLSKSHTNAAPAGSCTFITDMTKLSFLNKNSPMDSSLEVVATAQSIVGLNFASGGAQLGLKDHCSPSSSTRSQLPVNGYLGLRFSVQNVASQTCPDNLVHPASNLNAVFTSDVARVAAANAPSGCFYDVHIRFDQSKVALLGTQALQQDNVAAGQVSKLLLFFRDDGTGVIQNAPLTAMTFEQSPITITRPFASNYQTNQGFVPPIYTPRAPYPLPVYSSSQVVSTTPLLQSMTLDGLKYAFTVPAVDSLAQGTHTASLTYRMTNGINSFTIITASIQLQIVIESEATYCATVNTWPTWDFLLSAFYVYGRATHNLAMAFGDSQPGCQRRVTCSLADNTTTQLCGMLQQDASNNVQIETTLNTTHWTFFASPSQEDDPLTPKGKWIVLKFQAQVAGINGDLYPSTTTALHKLMLVSPSCADTQLQAWTTNPIPTELAIAQPFYSPIVTDNTMSISLSISPDFSYCGPHVSTISPATAWVTATVDRTGTGPFSLVWPKEFEKQDDPARWYKLTINAPSAAEVGQHQLSITSTMLLFPQITVTMPITVTIFNQYCRNAIISVQNPLTPPQSLTTFQTVTTNMILPLYNVSTTHNCGPIDVTWTQQKSNGAVVPLDAALFLVNYPISPAFVVQSQTAADSLGVYSINLKVSIRNYLQWVPVAEQTSCIVVTITDYCLQYPSVTRSVVLPDYNYNQGLIDFSFLATDFALSDLVHCPRTGFECRKNNGFTVTACDASDALGTRVALQNPDAPVFELKNPLSEAYPPGDYTLTFVSYQDMEKKKPSTVEVKFKALCMLSEPTTFYNVANTKGSIYYVKPYLTSTPTEVLDLTSELTPPTGLVTHPADCDPVNPILHGVYSNITDADGKFNLSSIATPLQAATSIQVTINDSVPIEWSQEFFFYYKPSNFYNPDNNVFKYPTVSRKVHYVDGYFLLEVESMPLRRQSFDLSKGPVTIEIPEPRLKDNGYVSDFLLQDPKQPRRLNFKMAGLERENVTRHLNITQIDKSKPGYITVEIKKVSDSLLDELELIACYNYGDVPTLQNLCDNEDHLQFTKARGFCFDELANLTITPSVLKSEQVILGQEAREVLDLATFDMKQKLMTAACGQLGFSLVNATQNEVVLALPQGKVFTRSINSTNMVGDHTVLFNAHLIDIDKQENYKKTLELSLVVQVSRPPAAFNTEGFFRLAPVAIEKPAPVYKALLGASKSFTFHFADPLAIKKDGLSAGQAPQDIEVVVSYISEPTVARMAEISNKAGVGFASLTLELDGQVAAKKFAEQASADSKANELTINVKVAVSFKTVQGPTAQFELVFQYGSDSNPESNQKTNETANSTSKAQQQLVAFEMNLLVQEALTSKLQQLDDFEIKASLKNIDSAGKVFLKFEPPFVAIPNDWRKLWDLREREKMAPKDLVEFEKELIKIMHVQFEKNSEELPQKYFYPELVNFEPSGIKIALNFSDPLLVSQGQEADKIKIRLLKSYFMNPDPVRASLAARKLSTLEDDGEYITIIEDMPLQLSSQSDFDTLSSTAEATQTVLTTGFVLTFVVNLVLNGVMSQLWNVFNTLQIIMVLDLLAVVLPSNVVFMKVTVNQIVNFKPVDTKTVQRAIFDPVFGSQIEVEDETQGSANNKSKASLLSQIFYLIVGVVFVALLIGLIILCQRKVYPRCCQCFKTLVNAILAKIMFNSILRSLIQTYLQNSIGMWTSLRDTTFDSKESATDFTVALLLCIGLAGYAVWTTFFLRKNQEKLHRPEVRARFDSIYQNVDVYHRQALFHMSLFLARRLLFAFLIVFFGTSIVLQVLVADALSTILLAFFLTVRPMVDKLNNCIQIVNELVVLVCIWLLFWFTNYVPQADTRYDLGWYFLYFIGADIALNVGFLIFNLVKKIYVAIRTAIYRHKAKALMAVRAAQFKERSLLLKIQKEQSEKSSSYSSSSSQSQMSFSDIEISSAQLRGQVVVKASDSQAAAQQANSSQDSSEGSSVSEIAPRKILPEKQINTETVLTKIQLRNTNLRPKILIETTTSAKVTTVSVPDEKEKTFKGTEGVGVQPFMYDSFFRSDYFAQTKSSHESAGKISIDKKEGAEGDAVHQEQSIGQLIDELLPEEAETPHRDRRKPRVNEMGLLVSLGEDFDEYAKPNQGGDSAADMGFASSEQNSSEEASGQESSQSSSNSEQSKVSASSSDWPSRYSTPLSVTITDSAASSSHSGRSSESDESSQAHTIKK